MNIFTHPNPVWRDRADFIIGIWIADFVAVGGGLPRWEQLWGRRLSDNCFELCCIPCFAPNLTLGDQVETATEFGREYAIQRIVKHSGYSSFQIWFSNSNTNNVVREVMEELTNLSCLTEWYSAHALGVSVSNRMTAEDVNSYLLAHSNLGHLEYQTHFV